MAHPALRRLPSVERVVVALAARGLLVDFPRRAATQCAREVIERARQRLRDGRAGPEAESLPDAVIDEAEALLRRRFASTLRRAINATGVILHTNLGRAPLSVAAQAAVAEAAIGYGTLEINLDDGTRGSRQAHLERLLATVTGAEAGFAVNNNAGAVLLALAALAAGREVVVARGELVEIGGSFRMPDVMAQSGARLVEVGTTNRTYVHDYEAAITPATAVLLKVHRSNFTLRGFVHEAPVDDLVALGRRRGVPVVYDLGSGCLVDLSAAGLPREPLVQAAVASGADLVLFSADKLLGGPQGGILVGRRESIERCRRHPLARALRMGKLDVAALAATLRSYIEPERAWKDIPVLAVLAASPSDRRRRARRMAGAVAKAVGDAAQVSVVSTEGEMGGGSLPGAPIPSFAVEIRPAWGNAPQWASRLRTGAPAVIGVVRDDALLLDVLALLPGEDRPVLRAVQKAAAALAPGQA